jgi:hypothetical protein
LELAKWDNLFAKLQNDPNGLSRGNKPDRFTANLWRLNVPKRSRVLLRHRSMIMAPEHCGRSVTHEIIKAVYIVIGSQPA